MDWYAWLSKTGLEPSVVYEYGLAFAQNELEEEDVAYFNHEFLQSMGITIAKHRLEILKLARREKSHHHGLLSMKHPMAKLLLALKKTKKSLANYIATLVHGNDGRALIVVPNKNKNKSKKKKNKNSSKNGGGAISYSTRWKKAMMLRSNSRKLVMFNSSFQDKLMLTNGGDYLGGEVVDGDHHDHDHDHDHDSVVVSTPKLDSYSSPLMYDLQQNSEEKTIDDDYDDQDDEYWTPALEEIRWDAMFQDLKPT